MQRRLSETVMDCYNAGFKHIVTGMSGQFEQLAGRIVSELKTKMPDMRLTVVMTPCECSGYARYLSGKGSDRDLWEYVETADNLKPVRQDSRLTDYTQKNRYSKHPSLRLICCYRTESIREAETRHLISLAERKPGLRIVNLYKP